MRLPTLGRGESEGVGMHVLRTLARALVAFVAVGIFVVGSGADTGPTITSDASDYAPARLPR